MIMSISSGGWQYIFELVRQLNISKPQNAWKQCIKPFTFKSHIFFISYMFWMTLKKNECINSNFTIFFQLQVQLSYV
jgi:hypothetical protein